MRLRGAGIEKVATILHGAGIGGLDTAESAQAVAEGALLGLYTFKRHFSKDEDKEKGLKELTVVEVDEIVEPGGLNPEEIVTPGIFVQRIVQRPVEFSPYD